MRFNPMLRVLQVYNDNIFFIDQDKPTAEEIEAWEEAAEQGAEAEEPPEPEVLGEAGEEEEETPREKELSDWVTVLSPGIELGYENDKCTALLKAKYDFYQYEKYRELNDIDYQYSGEAAYDATPYTRVTVDASYKRDSSPDRDLEGAGLILGTYIRDKQEYSVSVDHELTEYSTFNIIYSYRQDDFLTSDLDEQIAALQQAELDELAAEAEEALQEAEAEAEAEEANQGEESEGGSDAEEEEEELTPAEELLMEREARDFKMHSVAFTLNRDTGALLTDSYIFSTANYVQYATHTSVQDTFTLVAGIGYSYDEAFSLRVDGGARFSHEDYDDVQLKLLADYPFYDQVDVERQQDEWGPVAHASISYSSEWTTTSLDFSYDMQPASGKGTLTERTALRFGHIRRIGELFKIHCFASYLFNNRDGVYQLEPLADEEAFEVHNEIEPLRERLEEEIEPLYGVNEKSWIAGLEANWKLNRYCTLTGQYTYSTLEKKLIYSDASRNFFSLRLDIRYPFW